MSLISAKEVKELLVHSSVVIHSSSTDLITKLKELTDSHTVIDVPELPECNRDHTYLSKVLDFILGKLNHRQIKSKRPQSLTIYEMIKSIDRLAECSALLLIFPSLESHMAALIEHLIHTTSIKLVIISNCDPRLVLAPTIIAKMCNLSNDLGPLPTSEQLIDSGTYNLDFHLESTEFASEYSKFIEGFKILGLELTVGALDDSMMGGMSKREDLAPTVGAPDDSRVDKEKEEKMKKERDEAERRKALTIIQEFKRVNHYLLMDPTNDELIVLSALVNDIITEKKKTSCTVKDLVLLPKSWVWLRSHASPRAFELWEDEKLRIILANLVMKGAIKCPIDRLRVRLTDDSDNALKTLREAQIHVGDAFVEWDLRKSLECYVTSVIGPGSKAKILKELASEGKIGVEEILFIHLICQCYSLPNDPRELNMSAYIEIVKDKHDTVVSNNYVATKLETMIEEPEELAYYSKILDYEIFKRAQSKLVEHKVINCDTVEEDGAWVITQIVTLKVIDHKELNRQCGVEFFSCGLLLEDERQTKELNDRAIKLIAKLESNGRQLSQLRQRLKLYLEVQRENWKKVR